MFSKHYNRLSQDSDASKEQLLESDDASRFVIQKSLARVWQFVYVLVVVLAFSLASNVLLFAKLHYAQEHGHDPSFLGLERNIVKEIPHDDRDIDDPMWDAPEFDWYNGWVALDNDVTKAKGIPTSMHWPWDDSKSIYVFHSSHSLHCVYVLRDAMRRYRDEKQQIWPFSHVTHCLHVLREDTICNADDTPRYTGHLHAQENSTVLFSGTGQTRKCRDWSKLQKFSLEHSACYRRPLESYAPLLDRYKHCPDGSKPWEAIES